MRNRRLLLLAFGLLLAQVASVAAIVYCDDCSCDVLDDECLPGCEACLCCSTARTVVATHTGVDPSLVPESSVLPSSILLRRYADPQEIFHVPRPSLS